MPLYFDVDDVAGTSSPPGAVEEPETEPDYATMPLEELERLVRAEGFGQEPEEVADEEEGESSATPVEGREDTQPQPGAQQDTPAPAQAPSGLADADLAELNRLRALEIQRQQAEQAEREAKLEEFRKRVAELPPAQQEIVRQKLEAAALEQERALLAQDVAQVQQAKLALLRAEMPQFLREFAMEQAPALGVTEGQVQAILAQPDVTEFLGQMKDPGEIGPFSFGFAAGLRAMGALNKQQLEREMAANRQEAKRTHRHEGQGGGSGAGDANEEARILAMSEKEFAAFDKHVQNGGTLANWRNGA